MLTVFQQALNHPIEFISCFFLALIPVVIWLKIFLSKHPEKRSHVVITFFFGILSAVLVLGYQSLWGKGPINFIFFEAEALNFQDNIRGMVSSSILASFFIYLSVGLMEEVSKHYAVLKADRNIFESIDDVIELSIVAALGFAFLENIGYFFALILEDKTEDLLSTFLVRSVFVVFIHILCSAIYGYFYGLGHFAKPYMQMEIQKGRKFVIANFLHKLLHFRQTEMFRERMIMEGLVISVLLHGIYDCILDTGFVITIAGISKPLYVIMLPLYLVGGFWYLSFLLSKKENLQHFGHLEEKQVFIKTETEIDIRDRVEHPQEKLFNGKSISGYKDIVGEQINFATQKK